MKLIASSDSKKRPRSSFSRIRLERNRALFTSSVGSAPKSSSAKPTARLFSVASDEMDLAEQHDLDPGEIGLDRDLPGGDIRLHLLFRREPPGTGEANCREPK